MSADRVEQNKLVTFTYQITDRSGAVVERIDLPVTYVHGSPSGLLEKVESALLGAGPGEDVDVEISPEEGFGEHRPELTFTDEIDNVPEQFRHVGAEVPFQNEQGEVRTMRVSRIEGGRLTVDANHPFAGETLIFSLRVVSVREATPEEIASAATPRGPALH
jgi:FKBP-type peptidyl-prolyl cis-trans isomerase SlyD